MQDVIKLVPHLDIELGFERQEIEAFLTLPDAGVTPETGIIMVLGELGEKADSQYQANELRPFLANKLNCIAVGVNFFGILRANQVNLSQSFFHNLNRLYDANITSESLANKRTMEEVYRAIAEVVLAKGVTSLDLRCQPHLITGKGEYQSWGFLPAIDCLQVLGEVLRRYDVNHRKIIAFGKNYGAYIAMLMGKYAPHTFSTIIDSEGYSRTELKHVVSGELMEADYSFHFDLNNGLKFYMASTCNNPWTIEDETSIAYFSDSHRQVRSLLKEEHRCASETAYYIVHSENSETIKDKDKCVDILQNYNHVVYKRIASIGKPVPDREFLNSLISDDVINFEKTNGDTDFSLGSIHKFVCCDKIYKFEFSPAGDLHVSINVIGNEKLQ